MTPQALARCLGVAPTDRSIRAFADVLDMPIVADIARDVSQRYPAGPQRANAFASAMFAATRQQTRSRKNRAAQAEPQPNDRRAKREREEISLSRLMRERRSTL